VQHFNWVTLKANSWSFKYLARLGKNGFLASSETHLQESVYCVTKLGKTTTMTHHEEHDRSRSPRRQKQSKIIAAVKSSISLVDMFALSSTLGSVHSDQQPMPDTCKARSWAHKSDSVGD
jgi:hypothetical protein